MVDHLTKLQEFTEDHLFLELLNQPSHLPIKVQVLSRTKLFEKLAEAHQQLHSKPANHEDYPVFNHKSVIESQSAELEKRVQTLINSKEDLLDSEISLLKTFARLQYERGNYEASLKLLNELRRVDHIESWGELISNILLGRLEQAKSIAEDMVSETNDLKGKAWLLHASLFISYPSHPSFFYDLFSHSKFSHTVEVACPHLVRYLLSSSLLRKSSKTWEIIQTYNSSFKQDPNLIAFSQYLEDYNADNAISALDKFSTLIKQDYFLHSFETYLLREAKKFFISCHIRLNKNVEVSWIEKHIQEPLTKLAQELSEEQKLVLTIEGNLVSRVRN